MTSSLATLTQSKYYSPAFNGAIFDGPLRIYFAQYQEALALEIYFKIQQRLKSLGEGRQHLKSLGSQVFVMLYPSSDVFSLSFEVSDNNVAFSKIDNDFIFGINSHIDNDGYDTIYNYLEGLFSPGQC